MKEICIPFSDIADDKQAEVEIRIPNTGEIWRYRLEALPFASREMDPMKKKEKIDSLQQYIRSYNHNWELIQIFDANEKTGNIHLLYREKALQLANEQI
jgi:hypothetical protein